MDEWMDHHPLLDRHFVPMVDRLPDSPALLTPMTSMREPVRPPRAMASWGNAGAHFPLGCPGLLERRKSSLLELPRSPPISRAWHNLSGN
jgi:hypothetical protein